MRPNRTIESRKTTWLAVALCALVLAPVPAQESGIKAELSKYNGKVKILFETYRDGSWEIFSANPDGSSQTNLTNTPDEHEMYPQATADGKKICFGVDRGKDRDTIRSVYVMNADGSGRAKVADYAREHNWTPDGKVAYCPQLTRETFKPIDYFTKGLYVHDLETGQATPVTANDKLEHLYCQSFSPNGRWIAATVHAGMGIQHGILIIETQGTKILQTPAHGCRPVFSPDGKKLAWGGSDQLMQVGDLDTTSDEPKLLNIRDCVRLKKPEKIYHIDWSPDGRFFAFSRGPEGNGKANLPGTHFGQANEIIGVHAEKWDIYIVPARLSGDCVDLNTPEGQANALNLTSNGLSNKEPEWIVVSE